VPAGARFCPKCGQDLRVRGDERRVVTVLFGDIVGFTGLSETRDPEQVKNLVDDCFQRLVADIEAHGGRVDKIVGDAIVALFGAPVAHEDDAERAVRAALAMQRTLAECGEDLPVAVRMRIGVNTGEVLVGALRAGGDYTAMGDVVNTASRLQAAAAPDEVLVGPATYAATRRAIDYEALPPMRVRGRAEPVAVWRAVGVRTRPGQRSDRHRVPLVGRDAELGLLRHAVAAVDERARAALVLLLGEAGVGKSRLAEELADELGRSGSALVLEGRCVPYGEANVWWPIADALRHAFGSAADDPPERTRELARWAVAGVLGDPDPAGEAGALGPEGEQVLDGLLHLMGEPSALRDLDAAPALERALDALVAYLGRSAEDRLVVLVLSDLHWADDKVLEALDAVLERLTHRRVAVVATARPEIEARWHPPHGRHNLVVVTLDPLAPDAAARLVAELAGGRVGDGLVRQLLERGGGNPFFLEELVTLLGDAGVAHDDGTGAAVELPDTLRSLVAARLDGLSHDERRVLDDCAVLGRRGAVSAVQVMVHKHLGIDDVRPVLESLAAKDLLVLTGSGPGERWAFRSDVVREVAYATLTKADRARSHQSIAAYLEEHVDLDRDAAVDRITHHYVEAAVLARELGALPGVRPDLEDRALEWVQRAAQRAQRADLHEVAERLFGDGLRILGGRSGPLHRRLRMGRARSLGHLRDLVPARADACAAVEDARQAGPGGEADLAEALVVLADVAHKEADWPTADDALAEAGALYARLGDEQGAAEVVRLQGFAALFRHDHGRAAALLEDARARFVALGDRRGEAWALQNLAWCAFYSGRASEAEALLHRAEATFQELGDVSGRSWAQGLLAWTRFQQGHAAEAGALAERLLVDGAGGDRWARGMLLLLAGSVQLWSGRTAEALERLGEAHRAFDAIGDHFGLVQSSAVLGRALVLGGRIDEGIRLATSALEVPDPSSWEAGVAALAALAATVQIGDAARSERLLGLLPREVRERLDALGEAGAPGVGALDLAGVAHTELVTTLGLHLLQVGDAPGALGLLDAAAVRHDGVDPNLHAAAALAHAAAGDPARALEVAHDVERSPGATYLDRATAGVARALVHAGQGDAAAADAALDQVRAGVDATGDVVTQALVRLAGAVVGEALGLPDAPDRRAEADARLGALGLHDTAWRRAFTLGLGLAPA